MREAFGTCSKHELHNMTSETSISGPTIWSPKIVHSLTVIPWLRKHNMKRNTKCFANVNVPDCWRVADDTVCDKRTTFRVFGVRLTNCGPARLDNFPHHSRLFGNICRAPGLAPDRTSSLHPGWVGTRDALEKKTMVKTCCPRRPDGQANTGMIDRNMAYPCTR